MVRDGSRLDYDPRWCPSHKCVQMYHYICSNWLAFSRMRWAPCHGCAISSRSLGWFRSGLQSLLFSRQNTVLLWCLCILSLTCPSHQAWILASSVSSGWKLVPNTFPCLTAMISPAPSSNPVPATGSLSVRPRPGRVAMISTGRRTSSSANLPRGSLEGAMTVPSNAPSPDCSPRTTGSSFSTTGARMNTPLKGATISPLSLALRNGRAKSASKLSVWRPKWFRFTLTSRPPTRSCPPFLVRLADSASKIKPAHVPHVGFRRTLKNVSGGQR